MWPKPDTLCQVWAKSWVGTFFPCYVVDLIFQTVNSVRANNLILKYRRFTTLEAEFKDFETRLKFDTEPKHGWVTFKIVFNVSRFELALNWNRAVFVSLATWFNFLKFGLRFQKKYIWIRKFGVVAKTQILWILEFEAKNHFLFVLLG